MKKHFIFIFWILFFSSPLFSQQWKHYKDKIKTAIVANDFKKAIQYSEEGLKFAESQFSLKAPEYEEALTLLSEAHYGAGNKDSAFYFLDLVLKCNLSRLSDTLPEFGSIIATTCSMFRYYTDIDQGIKNLKNAIALVKTIKNVDYSIISKLSNIYTNSFTEQNTEEKKQSLETIKKEKGAESSEYFEALKNAVREAKAKWDYNLQKQLLPEYISLKEKKTPSDTSVGTDYYDLAYYHFISYGYDSARIFFEKALNYWKTKNLKHIPTYAMGLYNLAITRYSKLWMNQGGKAENYLINENEETAILNLFLEAEPLLLRHFGKTNTYYTSTVLYIASIYNRKDDLANAEKYYRLSLEVNKDPNDSLGYKSLPALWGLGAVYVRQNQLDKAEPIFYTMNDLTFAQIRSILEYVAIPSEKRISQYFFGYNYNLNWNYSYFYDRYKTNPKVSEVIYNNELIKKGLVLRVMKHKIKSILQSNDTSLVNTMNQWLSLRQQVAKLYLLPVSERRVNVQTLEKKMQELEGALYYKTWQLRDKLRTPITNWKDVQKRLKPDEAAIEFVSFDYLSWGKSWLNDSVLYFALINRPGMKQPSLVYLFDGKKIQDFFNSLPRETNYDYVASMYGSDTLYKLIWKPLEKELNGVKRIYYSPSAVLHKISFPALVNEDGVLLADRYDLHRYTTTAYLVESKDPLNFKPEYEALFYGGILYDLDSDSLQYHAKKFKKENPDYFIRDRSFEWSDSLRSGTYWEYLEGTKIEAQKINTLIGRKLKKSTLLLERDAVEESIKTLPKSPDIIHIATHGFFFPEYKVKSKEPITVSDESSDPNVVYKNPLLRSGLVFAGANNVWKGNKPPTGVEDGILTAYEVSQLNLMNTKIVILSACETGLGEIKGSEGVYGLQRAFKQAGVDYIIMSLWQIPDEQTVELMEYFYNYWSTGDDVRTAFNKAQAQMRKKYNPYYWAAFVLME